MNIDLLLGRPIKIGLEENTYTKTNFDGLYLKNYKMKEFLPTIGYETYVSWCNSITMVPKDIADILWVKYELYYKTLDSWTFLFNQCFDFNNQKPYENSPILKGLKFMFGYDFSPSFDVKKETPEEAFFFNIYDEKGRWLAKINKKNFEKIVENIKLVNSIKPSELSGWKEFAYERHEKRALQYYHDKRMRSEKEDSFELNVENILRFLKLETSSSYSEMMEWSLYELYNSYSMKTDTLRTLALNIGIYSGNVKINSGIQNSLIFGTTKKHEAEEKNLASGNNIENIAVGNDGNRNR